MAALSFAYLGAFKGELWSHRGMCRCDIEVPGCLAQHGSTMHFGDHVVSKAHDDPGSSRGRPGGQGKFGQAWGANFRRLRCVGQGMVGRVHRCKTRARNLQPIS